MGMFTSRKLHVYDNYDYYDDDVAIVLVLL